MERYIYKKVEEDFIDKLRVKLEELEGEIDKLLRIEGKTYNNFFNEMEILEEELSKMIQPISNENSTYITDIGKKLYKEFIPIMNEHASKINQNEEIAGAIMEIYEREDLDPVKRRILEKKILEFRSNGIGIEEEKKKRIKEINLELSKLSNEFSQNVTDATNAYELIVEDEGVIDEMPNTDKLSAQVEEGRWKFTLHGPSYISFMTYCRDRKLRREMYRAYVTRAPQNEEIAERVLKLRREKANILGYENYREFSVASKTADSGEEVIEFLKKLGEEALPTAKKEVEELYKLATDLGYEGVEYYDTAYLGRKLKERKYNFDSSEVKPYFELERVVKGMFEFLEELFNLKFKKQEDAELWSEKAQAYEVTRGEEELGCLLIDLETSETKRGGAWANSLQRSYLRADGTRELSIGKISCNFPRSREGVPSLLSQDNVVTLFHEMGHALHNITSAVDEVSAAGFAGTEWDVVEYPSQWFQEFANNSFILKRFAKHYITGEVISDELLERMFESQKFGEGMAINRQIEFGLFDMLIHDTTETREEIQRKLDGVRELVAPLKTPEYNKFQNQFSHIFAGGYAAGYYSYKWAEVLSADSYTEMTKGGRVDRELANNFYDKILSRGGSKNMKESFVEVHKRQPDGRALLKLVGII